MLKLFSFMYINGGKIFSSPQWTSENSRVQQGVPSYTQWQPHNKYKQMAGQSARKTLKSYTSWELQSQSRKRLGVIVSGSCVSNHSLSG